MTAANSRPGAGWREWVGLAVLGLPTFLVTVDFSVLYLAVPHLTADLAPSGVQQLWIVDIYGLLIAGFLVTMGTIGDRIGRKKLLLAGTVVFGIASVAAYSTSPEMLIASRALLGVAGAAVTTSVLVLVASMFTDQEQRGLALALYLTCFMGGATLGPLVGGVLLEYFWWGSMFLVAVPGIVLLLVFCPSLLPEQKAPRTGKLDAADRRARAPAGRRGREGVRLRGTETSNAKKQICGEDERRMSQCLISVSPETI